MNDLILDLCPHIAEEIRRALHKCIYIITESIDYRNKMQRWSRSRLHIFFNPIDRLVLQYSEHEWGAQTRDAVVVSSASAEASLDLLQKQIFLQSLYANWSGTSRSEESGTEALYQAQPLSSKLCSHLWSHWAEREMLFQCSWPLENLKARQARSRSWTQCRNAFMIQWLKWMKAGQAHLSKFNDSKSETLVKMTHSLTRSHKWFHRWYRSCHENHRAIWSSNEVNGIEISLRKQSWADRVCPIESSIEKACWICQIRKNKETRSKSFTSAWTILQKIQSSHLTQYHHIDIRVEQYCLLDAEQTRKNARYKHDTYTFCLSMLPSSRPIENMHERNKATERKVETSEMNEELWTKENGRPRLWSVILRNDADTGERKLRQLQHVRGDFVTIGFRPTYPYHVT